MAGRKAVLSWEDTKAANPCVPKDHSGSFEYGGTTMEMKSAGDGSTFDSCSKLVFTVMKADADCGFLKKVGGYLSNVHSTALRLCAIQDGTCSRTARPSFSRVPSLIEALG